MSEQAKRAEEVRALIDELHEKTCSEDDEGVPFYDAGLADGIIRKWAEAALQEAERRGDSAGYLRGLQDGLNLAIDESGNAFGFEDRLRKRIARLLQPPASPPVSATGIAPEEEADG